MLTHLECYQQSTHGDVNEWPQTTAHRHAVCRCLEMSTCNVGPIIGYAVVAYGQVIGEGLLHLCIDIAWCDATHVGEFIVHLVHHVMS